MTAKKRIPTWAYFIFIPIGLLVALILGVWGFMGATATPLHTDPLHVPMAASGPPSPKWNSAVERARELARATLVEKNLPGLSVAVGVNGELVWAEGLGLADLGTRELDFTGQLVLGKAVQANPNRVVVTPETKFRIVGVSQALTSAAVGLLLEKGQLKLDEEIQTYVPAFPKKQWPVTLRQLMAHTAGVGNDGGDEAPVDSRCEHTLDGLKLDNFAARELRFQPGTQSRYSSYAWIVVSAAVEAAAGEPFFRFMRSQIFEPLDMNDTMPDTWTEPIRNRATAYFPRFGGDTRYGPDLAREGDHSCWSGGGAFLSTPSDLVRFSMAINGGKLLQPATATQLQTRERLSSGEDTGAGLGWNVQTVTLAGESTRLVRQDDSRSIGGSTSLLTFPERGIIVAVTSNITFADTSSLGLKIAEIFAEQGQSPGRK